MALIDMQQAQAQSVTSGSRWQSVRLSSLAGRSAATILLAAGAVVILIPFLFMISTSLKSKNQLRAAPPPLLPWESTMVEIDGVMEPLYHVTLDGEPRKLALVKNQPGGMGIFVDPANPAESMTLKIAEQTPIRHLEIHPENYAEAMTSVPFPRYLLNTLLVTFLGMAGVLVSCTMVAYGFSRFRAPWLNWLFIVLLSTIMLPRQVTLIPVYVLFQRLGWVDTLLPLIVPAFFANAYDVFLLRQFFMTIPRELEDAALIDGCSRFRIYYNIVLPLAKPVLATVTIFAFMGAWNDYLGPLIYLGNKNQYTLSLGLQAFVQYQRSEWGLLMAASTMMIVPVIFIFFLAQKSFVQGITLTGLKG